VHLLIIGGSRTDRLRAARLHIPSASAPLVLDADTLPFVNVAEVSLPPGPRVVIIDDLERAFPDAQAGGTRLVLTQSTYLVQKWVDLLDEGDRIVATADRAALERCAPEALQGRGAWDGFEIIDLNESTRRVTEDTTDTKEGPLLVSTASFVVDPPSSPLMARGYVSIDPAERLRLCREAVSLDPESAMAHLALASALRETRDGVAAREALDRAAALAPDWEAVAYESGKLWLVYDDMLQARDAFQCAANLMPTFSAALSNLGATLGEMDEPAAALHAFRQALAHDPRSFTILNNIGVVCRELGRLDESEAAFRRVIAINPEFVFGHYNLGHTLFLIGNYRDALDAYEQGQRRDPERNRRQGCRLALVRFANGDAAGAERELWRFANQAPPDEREDLLLEAYEIAHALLTQYPALAPHRPFLDRIGAEIAKSE
jgi:tetratricopeptide (TPR) repeat protein